MKTVLRTFDFISSNLYCFVTLFSLFGLSAITLTPQLFCVIISHETKFDVEDGWPAFGACVLGSIEIISAEERRSQIEKEDKACVKIQACVRGKICRENVEKMLEEMIGELMKKNNGGKNNGSTKTENNNCNYNEKNLSYESETPKKWQAKTTGSILSRPLGENLKFHTLSCHRCKSYLGDVFAEDNEGNYGEKYVEHHRVNGRSLKYMHANLPKRTMVWSSLLFAGQSQRRQLGLPNVKLKNDASFVPFREVLVRKDGRKDRFDPLSVSDHPSSYRTRIPQKSSPSPRRKKNSVDPLGSVSCHERLMTPTSRINTSSRRRPMRRGSTNSLVSIEERKTFLETSLKVSFH